MSTLLEIADSPRTVKVSGKDILVYGVSAGDLATILTRFPAIGRVFAGSEPNRNEIMKVAPDALHTVIATGCGFGPEHPNHEKAVSAASRLGVGDQIEIISEVIRLTFPKGIGPFVQKLEEMGLFAQVAQEANPLSQVSGEPSKN